MLCWIGYWVAERRFSPMENDRRHHESLPWLLAAIFMVLFTIAAGAVTISVDTNRYFQALMPSSTELAAEADDSDVEVIRDMPLTDSVLRDFGHIACPEMTVDELSTSSPVTVGNADYILFEDLPEGFAGLADENCFAIENGVYKDRYGYMVCSSGSNEVREIIDTPLGPGKVYMLEETWNIIGIYRAAV